ncbi:MAG: DUF3793 family protein [Clostridia bacterium]|nr:DUF3793 family protein [Clostridia bacterium]
MKNRFMKDYFNTIKKLDSYDYLKGYLIFYSSQTIDGIKPATVISLAKTGKNEYRTFQEYKEKIEVDLDIKTFVLKERESSATIIIYNEDSLKDSLFENNNKAFLKRFGYTKCVTLKDYLNVLKTRFNLSNLCPHEIGIFLGYPLNEIKTYINCPNKECIFYGYWKVYHDIDLAKVIFRKYDKIKYTMMAEFLNLIEKDLEIAV